MQTIRCFIAIPLSSEISSAIAKLISRLKNEGDGIKWIPTDNIHLTIKFLGDVDNVEIPKICDALHDLLETVEPFELRFIGAGGFPSLDRPRVLYGGVEDPTGRLSGTVESIEVEMAELGFKREPRDYRPHITLGRTKGSRRKAADQVIDKIRELDGLPLGEMLVDEAQLMASFLDKHGPTYQVMDSIDLG